MSGGAGPSKKTKTYHFHTGWEVNFFHDGIFEVHIPHLPLYTIAIPKKGNVKRHFRTVHGKYNTDFPLKSELRKKKVKELKSHTAFIFHTTNFKSESAIQALFRVSHVIV